MAIFDLTPVGLQVLVSLAASAAVALLLLLLAFVSRRLGHVILKTNLWWAGRRLSPRAKEYLEEWVGSWEDDLREDMRGEGATRLGTEVHLLLRIMSLPRYLSSLRRQAEQAAGGAAATRVRGWSVGAGNPDVVFQFEDGQIFQLDFGDSGLTDDELTTLYDTVCDLAPALRPQVLGSLATVRPIWPIPPPSPSTKRERG